MNSKADQKQAASKTNKSPQKRSTLAPSTSVQKGSSKKGMRADSIGINRKDKPEGNAKQQQDVKSNKKAEEKVEKKVEEKPREAQSQSAVKQAVKKQRLRAGKPIQAVELEPVNHTPKDTNISLLTPLLQIQVTHPNLINYYSSQPKHPFTITPIQCHHQGDRLRLLFPNLDYQPYTAEVASRFPPDCLRTWTLQLFHSLPVISPQSLYPRVSPHNVYFMTGPMTQQSKDAHYGWYNPMRCLVSGAVADEKEYLGQLREFGVGAVATWGDLESGWVRGRFGTGEGVVEALGRGLGGRVQQGELEVEALVGQQAALFLKQAINCKQKSKLIAYCRASTHLFDPTKFWSAVANQKQPQQMLLLQLSDLSCTVTKFLVLYSRVFPTTLQPFKAGTYTPDPDRTTRLLDFSNRMQYRVQDPKFAFMCCPSMLLCIGKCDVVLSAYNVTNLCYFPVTYANADPEQPPGDAEGLCLGKKFNVREMYAIRLQQP